MDAFGSLVLGYRVIPPIQRQKVDFYQQADVSRDVIEKPLAECRLQAKELPRSKRRARIEV